MVRPPIGMNAYEFVVMAGLRAQQWMQGCVALVEGDHKPTVLALMEVSTGRIRRATEPAPVPVAIADAGVGDT
jgi:DNA-directed RNA polymerase subunit K/omega